MKNDRQITITTGRSRRDTEWRPQVLQVSQLWERLRTPQRGAETMAEYLALPKAKQDDLKDVGGYVAGVLSGPRRKAGAVAGRDVITLDLDNIAPGQTDPLCAKIGALGCGYCIYSTRKHRPDAPRLRVLLPLDRTATPDEYEACARRMADIIGISLADPSTFEPSRLMYWPSCCSDGEYVFYCADLPLLSVDGLLATYADWRDMSAWPVCPGAVTPARLAAKQGDPLSKHGVVGAFCRVYDVPSAIDKFLPGVYEEADIQGRYTFTGGSTTGGAVLYDDGKFLYSHHATDPCGGRLVNAFDLVRLHRFGDLDDTADPGTPTIRLPSYTAMQEAAAADQQVSSLLLRERWENATAGFTAMTGDTPQTPAAAAAPAGLAELKRDAEGRPVKSVENLKIYINTDPALAGFIRLNLFSGRLAVTGALPWTRPGAPATWTDADAVQLRIYLERFFGKLSKNDVSDAVTAAAGDYAFHPVRDYLGAVTWDGVPRLDTLLVDYMGAADTDYTRAVTRKALVAAVARVMSPGCKYDYMTVLVGKQGRNKSTLLARLGGEWFSDSLRTFGDKDSMETIQGTWINEVAEMQAMARAEVEAVKMFITKASDYYRASYGQYAVDRPRQCVFFGTTNTRECLTDITGGRRFWIVDIDVRPRSKNVFTDLAAERDQVWAEAVARWRWGEPLYLEDAAIEQAAGAVQEDHRARHPWEGIISEFLDKEVPEDWAKWDEFRRNTWNTGGMQYDGPSAPRSRVCAVEVWCEALGRRRSDLKNSDSRVINAILEHLPGWGPAGVQKAGAPYGPQRCYQRDN